MIFDDVSQALPALSRTLLTARQVPSRLGETTRELTHEHITLLRPWQREVLTRNRHADIAAQIFETMWVLSGQDKVDVLSQYLPRANDFAVDGEWPGAYGPRLRAWGDRYPDMDQIDEVYQLLLKDSNSRRAVIQIFNPDEDWDLDSPDVPCNNWLHFMIREDKLHLNIGVRSNDLVWGWSGINAFEWSALQEILAAFLGVGIGQMTFNISSLHLYDRHFKRAEIFECTARDSAIVPFTPSREMVRSPEAIKYLDHLLDKWFALENKIRNGESWDPEYMPEPMFRAWLHVIRWKWSGEMDSSLHGTRLEAAIHEAPKKTSPFVKYVDALHREKHAAYGDSWCRRGELRGIIPNIDRKLDRLMVPGAGDTSADTAIDLLVYLVLYLHWLSKAETEQGKLISRLLNLPIKPTLSEDEFVLHTLRYLAADSVSTAKRTTEDLVQEIKYQGDKLGKLAVNSAPEEEKIRIVNTLLPLVYKLAARLWHRGQNETRPWRGYENG
jgi:thymidylate synthase